MTKTQAVKQEPDDVARPDQGKRQVVVDRGHDSRFKTWAGTSILSLLRLLPLVIVTGILLVGLVMFVFVLVKGLLIPVVLIGGIILLGRYLWRRYREGRSDNISGPGRQGNGSRSTSRG
jgi:hypothetical protein